MPEASRGVVAADGLGAGGDELVEGATGRLGKRGDGLDRVVGARACWSWPECISNNGYEKT